MLLLLQLKTHLSNTDPHGQLPKGKYTGHLNARSFNKINELVIVSLKCFT
uniref:Uncharacterized protein n=1 Tax=Arundo donax TaxID=35708 RepID=A0A0A8ZFP5_ARUDO